MKKQVLTFLIPIFSIIISCDKNDDPERFIQKEYIRELELKNGVVSGRLVADNQFINLEFPDENADTITLKKLYTLQPLEYNNAQLKISSIYIQNEIAGIGYYAENQYSGAVELVYFGNQSAITVISQLLFPETNIHNLSIYEDSLYLAESVDISINEKYESAAAFEIVPISNNTLTKNTFQFDISGDSGTDICLINNIIYISSNGNHGGLTEYTKENSTFAHFFEELDIVELIELPNNFFLGQKSPARLSLLALDYYEIELRKLVGDENIIDFYPQFVFEEGYIFTALGKDGLKLLSGNSGEMLSKQVCPETPSGANPDDYQTFAVAVSKIGDETYVFTANGKAGLQVYNLYRTNFRLLAQYTNNESLIYLQAASNILFLCFESGQTEILRIDF